MKKDNEKPVVFIFFRKQYIEEGCVRSKRSSAKEVRKLLKLTFVVIFCKHIHYLNVFMYEPS